MKMQCQLCGACWPCQNPTCLEQYGRRRPNTRRRCTRCGVGDVVITIGLPLLDGEERVGLCSGCFEDVAAAEDAYEELRRLREEIA